MWCWNKPLRIWVPHYIQMLWYTQNLTHCARSSPLKCIHIYRHWQPLTTSPTTIHTWLDLHNSFLFPCFHLGPSMAQPSASSQQSLFTCNQTMFLFYWKPSSSIPARCKSQSLSGLQTPAAQASRAICDLTSHQISRYHLRTSIPAIPSSSMTASLPLPLPASVQMSLATLVTPPAMLHYFFIRDFPFRKHVSPPDMLYVYEVFLEAAFHLPYMPRT